MKKHLLGGILILLSVISCTEKVDETNRYVFSYPTAISYLQSHEQYSEFCRLLSMETPSDMTTSTLTQLLGARGHYTIFAPTNEAIQDYLNRLKEKNIIDEASWNGFRDERSLDSIRKVIVLNSILDMGDDKEALFTCDFPYTQDAEIITPSMYERKLVVHYGDNSKIYINDCLFDERNCDISVLNGVIHSMHSVIAPSQNTLSDFILQTIKGRVEGYYVACQLLKAVGMEDTLGVYRDDVYEDLYKRGKITSNRYPVMEHRYVGFTFFAETDEFWSRELGKPALDITVDDVVAYLEDKGIYPDARRDDDYTNEDNLLNQFVTYHLLPERLNTDRLVVHGHEFGYTTSTMTPSVPVYDYYTTMGKRRILKIYESKESNGIYLNRFAKLDNGRHGTYHELWCDPDKEGILIGQPNVQGDNNVRNAMVYPIDKLLYYSDETRDQLMRRRMRFDVSSLFPEIMNNDIRLNRGCDFPIDQEYKYLSNLSCQDGSIFCYELSAEAVYQGDQFPGKGVLDITMKMPPVPRAGIYEVRSFQHAYTNRSIYQFYWGTDPNNLASVGLPIDFRIGGQTSYYEGQERPSRMGWEYDTTDDDYNAEMDKKLRNKDYMKGPNYIIRLNGNEPQRTMSGFTRRILLRQYMEPEKDYYIRFRSCIDDPERYILLDYFEYCSKEVYDNPNEPEDIW